MSRAARGEQGQSKQSEGWQEPRCPHQLVGETGESLIAAPSVFILQLGFKSSCCKVHLALQKPTCAQKGEME